MIVTTAMMRALCARALVSPLPRMSPMTSSLMMNSRPREEADIVIAGGGMVGCSAALALANLGKNYLRKCIRLLSDIPLLFVMCFNL